MDLFLGGNWPKSKFSSLQNEMSSIRNNGIYLKGTAESTATLEGDIANMFVQRRENVFHIHPLSLACKHPDIC